MQLPVTCQSFPTGCGQKINFRTQILHRHCCSLKYRRLSRASARAPPNGPTKCPRSPAARLDSAENVHNRRNMFWLLTHCCIVLTYFCHRLVNCPLRFAVPVRRHFSRCRPILLFRITRYSLCALNWPTSRTLTCLCVCQPVTTLHKELFAAGLNPIVSLFLNFFLFNFSFWCWFLLTSMNKINSFIRHAN